MDVERLVVACGNSLCLGVEDEASCQLERGHDGDHLATWMTNPPRRVQAEIRWRDVKDDA